MLFYTKKYYRRGDLTRVIELAATIKPAKALKLVPGVANNGGRPSGK